MIKISLKNYLLKLDNPIYIRKGSDNIRVYKIGNIIKKIYSNLKEFKSIEYIENNTGRCHQTFSNWILEKTGIPIQELYFLCKYWKKVCKKNKEEFKKLWTLIYESSNYFGCVNGKIIKLPKYLCYKLIYLLGYILGDGHLADPDKSYDKLTSYNSEIRITDGYKETFIFLKDFFEDLFDYTPKIYSEKSKVNKEFYRFVIHSKPLHRFLMIICGVPVGNKSKTIDIPKIIKNSPLELQKYFISWFFDADGCIRLSQGKFPEISISQLNPKILLSIMKVSKKFGVKWSGPYKMDSGRNHSSVIKITNKEHTERFLNYFTPLNPIKLKQSELIWKKLRSQHISPSKWMEIGDGVENIKEMHMQDIKRELKL